jgi:hypothetical protein
LPIRFDAAAPYEAGAALLTALIWPEAIDNDFDMAQRFTCLCQLYLTHLRSGGEPDETWESSTQRIKPTYLMQPWDLVVQFEEELQRRLPVRMAAADIVAPFLREAHGLSIDLPPGVPRLSLNAMSAHVLPDTGESDPHNIEKRTWRPSRPVVHIAAALAAARALAKRDGWDMTITDLFRTPPILGHVVELSELYADLLLKTTRFTIPPEEQIRLSLTLH